MYEKLNITENHLKVLSLFTRGFDKEYYIREVQRLLGISPRTAQLILDDLEKKTVLESDTRGKIRVYRIKKSESAKNYLLFTEQYKKILFVKTRPLIREIISKIIPFIDGIGVIFGSYAKGIEKKDSDLDIFVIGKCDLKEVKKISKIYGIDASIKLYPAKVFEKDMERDILIKEVMLDHIIILKLEKFIKVVMKDG